MKKIKPSQKTRKFYCSLENHKDSEKDCYIRTDKKVSAIFCKVCNRIIGFVSLEYDNFDKYDGE